MYPFSFSLPVIPWVSNKETNAEVKWPVQGHVAINDIADALT